jgi:hypothetical protein
MKGLRFAAAAAAVCGLLVLAPTASAKSFLYKGPVEQPQMDPFIQSPRIDFRVRFSKNKKGKLVPKSVPKLNVRNLWYQCEHPAPGSGSTNTIFYPGAINDTESKVIVENEFPVKKKNFSTQDSDGLTVIEVLGGLKGNSASGVVRLSESTEPGSGFDVGYCDSGFLDWTASTGF